MSYSRWKGSDGPEWFKKLREHCGSNLDKVDTVLYMSDKHIESYTPPPESIIGKIVEMEQHDDGTFTATIEAVDGMEHVFKHCKLISCKFEGEVMPETIQPGIALGKKVTVLAHPHITGAVVEAYYYDRTGISYLVQWTDNDMRVVTRYFRDVELDTVEPTYPVAGE